MTYTSPIFWICASPVMVPSASCAKTGLPGYRFHFFISLDNEKKQSLADFLDESVFVGDAGIEVSPTPEDVAGFNTYIENYKAGLPIEEAAVKFK